MGLLDNLFTKLGERQALREQSAADAYEQLVNDLADGQDLKPDQVEATLDRAGKTVGALEAAVELKQRRREWAARLKDRPSIAARLAEISREQVAERERFQELRGEHELAMEALREEHAALHSRLAQIDEARRQLAVTSPANRAQSALAPQIRPVVQRIDALTRQREPILQAVRRATAAEAKARSDWEDDTVAQSFGGKPDKRFAELAEQTAAARTRLAAVDADLQAARAELAELNDQTEELQAEALTP